ncbi:MAG: hypothetical protein R6U95_00195 [Bacteroidales bacterium]
MKLNISIIPFVGVGLLSCLFCITLTSCNTEMEYEKDNIVAEVGDKVFTENDLIQRIPATLSSNDSSSYAASVIKKWVEKQLLYEQALLNVPDNNNAIQKQVEQYAQDLYIHRYEELYIHQKLDTLISTTEISEYYEEQKKDFILNEVAVKPLFIVFPKDLDLNRVNKWFYSLNSENLDQLKDFTYQFSSQFHFSDKWFYMSDFLQLIPEDKLPHNVIYSKTRKISQDSLYYYYIRISEVAKSGDYIPKELVSNNIASTLLHKRKQKCLQKMRSKIYTDAVKNNEFEIYN